MAVPRPIPEAMMLSVYRKPYARRRYPFVKRR
jgi:hypothetical protein